MVVRWYRLSTDMIDAFQQNAIGKFRKSVDYTPTDYRTVFRMKVCDHDG